MQITPTEAIIASISIALIGAVLRDDIDNIAARLKRTLFPQRALSAAEREDERRDINGNWKNPTPLCEIKLDYLASDLGRPVALVIATRYEVKSPAQGIFVAHPDAPIPIVDSLSKPHAASSDQKQERT